MVDRYIDHDETQVYGPHTVRNIDKLVVGKVPEMDGAVKHTSGLLQNATVAVKSAVDKSRAKDSTIRVGTETKRSALKQSKDTMGRFSSHLDTHPQGSGVDRKAYFTQDGTSKGVGTSAANILMCVSNIAAQLADETCKVREREYWLQEFKTLETNLQPVLAHSDNAKTDRRGLTPQVESALAAWLLVYAATKCQVEAVLKLTGQMDLMTAVFHDLVVHPNAKITSIPESQPE